VITHTRSSDKIIHGADTQMNEQLREAKEILAEKRALLRKHPDKFSLRAGVRKWSKIVADLEQG